jgi:2,4-dienoyl-CoA reductase-like NADH-dependent reductase (Old Yellow Enzyme family)
MIGDQKPSNKGFFLEAVDGITKAWGSDRVGVRISPSNVCGGIQRTDRWGTYSYLVERLNDFDLAYIHIVDPRIAGNRDIDPQFDLGSERFRPLIRGETRLLSAGVHTRESGNAAIASGHADLIAFGAISLRIPTSSHGFGREPRSIATTAPPHDEKNPHQSRIVSGQIILPQVAKCSLLPMLS